MQAILGQEASVSATGAAGLCQSALLWALKVWKGWDVQQDERSQAGHPVQDDDRDDASVRAAPAADATARTKSKTKAAKVKAKSGRSAKPAPTVPRGTVPTEKAEKAAAKAAAQKGSLSDLLRNPSLGDAKRLLTESLRIHLPYYLIAAVAMLVVAGTTAATAWMMQFIIDAMTNTADPLAVRAVALAVVVIFFVKGMATYVQTVAMSRAGNRIVATQQERLYEKLLRQGVGFFDERESSSLLLRVTQSANSARSLIEVVVTSLVRDLFTLIGLVAVMVWQQPVMSMVALLFGPLAYMALRVLLAKMRVLASKDYTLLGAIIQVVQETSHGIRVIKTFGLEDEMFRRMRQATKAVERRSKQVIRVQAMSNPVLEVLTGLAIAAVVILSTVQFGDMARPSPGALMSFITALLMAYEPAKRLAKVRFQIEMNLVGIARMYEVIDAPETLPEAPDAQALPPGPGELRFEGVQFSFASENGGRKAVLKGIDQVFEAGKMTALVGPSGGGKSTILNLMLRLYDPDKGRVLVDGVDLRGVTLASLRARMSFVAQDTFLFSTTIRENIRLGRRGATDEEIEEAARIAHAHEFIMELPKGYDTEVGENGTFLSGGQKQRLSIARAVVRKADILLLDEATSALDATSEALVRDALANIFKGVTTVVIAHRLSTILDADTICYVEGGRILESGTLDALLEKNGKFRKIYDQQFGQTKA